MGGINLTRVVWGGLLAGLIINIFEFVLNGIVLGDQWPVIMASLNRPQLEVSDIVWFNVLGFIEGIVAIWTYAAIRPRFGAGVGTAIIAGLLTWVTASALASATPEIMGMIPMSITLLMVGVGLVEIIVASVAGAYFYKEEA